LAFSVSSKPSIYHFSKAPDLAKLLLVFAIVALVFWLLKSYRKGLDKSGDPRIAGDEDMVRCAECGVHHPRSESIAADGRFFCSTEHRRLHKS
jgi:uncharacterized protein